MTFEKKWQSPTIELNPEPLDPKDYKVETSAINPAHYKDTPIECIEAIKAAMTEQQFHGYLRGNVMKYLWRYENKGGKQDLEKAEWYLKRLIEEL